MNNMHNQLSTRLKQLRTEKGLTQQQVADALNLNSVSYLRYEKGQREPSLDILMQLAIYFDVSVDYLLGLSEI